MKRGGLPRRRLVRLWRVAEPFAASTLLAFGGVSALVQFVGELYPHTLRAPGLISLATAVVCLAWSAWRNRPVKEIAHRFHHPATAVRLRVGDLFEQDAHLVVGFSDTFDTALAGSRVISPASVQGQLLERVYGGDVAKLDRELTVALHGRQPILMERRGTKPVGKLKRYPIGTVAVLGTKSRLLFAVAYSSMGSDGTASSSADLLWQGLNGLWDAVYSHAERGSVAMPLIGSGLARVDSLDREALIRLILISYIAASRSRVVSRELRIVISPADAGALNLREIRAFLRSLDTIGHAH
ncbi:macro domain-containing protein [Actinocrinis sp.]|uniref:macro domain-containing protein n=1 Tax=Actinocrinis sp. TaxID=1920516 RepID=UPI002D3E49D7|nr:macro domain-containing protein [Actinocrinis sp.]HZP49592.1 macro domain-containing protein [Actinocrinis sp.]